MGGKFKSAWWKWNISRWAEGSETAALGLDWVVREDWEVAPGCGRCLALVNEIPLEWPSKSMP